MVNRVLKFQDVDTPPSIILVLFRTEEIRENEIAELLFSKVVDLFSKF